MKKLSILYLTPNFNHYKARQLNLLSENINLTVISGTGRKGMGDKEIDVHNNFNLIQLNVDKQNFGKSKIVRKELKKHFKQFSWVLIPTEKKNILLFIYALYLRIKNKKTKLFTHSHPISKSGKGQSTILDKIVTKFYYSQLDRVVFYTEYSCHWAVENKLIDSRKAFWANNTVDNFEIEKHYSYELPPKDQPIILFIGRLIPSKHIEDLMKYFHRLKEIIPNLRLEIIGDGPERVRVQGAAEQDSNIIWHGTLVDEDKIAPIMKRAAFVFIPGNSGLSINHAFAYGRPYVTLKRKSHGPEISYIDKGVDGYVLEGDLDSNIKSIKNLLLNRELLEQFCNNAKRKGEKLSLQNWVSQMKSSLLYDS